MGIANSYSNNILLNNTHIQHATHIYTHRELFKHQMIKEIFLLSFGYYIAHVLNLRYSLQASEIFFVQLIELMWCITLILKLSTELLDCVFAISVQKLKTIENCKNRA